MAFHQFQFLPGRPHAVGHDRGCLSEEPIAVIGIAVTGALLFQIPHPLYLRDILREVRLHGQLVLGRQITTGLQHLWRTRRHESRGDNRAYQGIRLIELSNQRLVAFHHLLHCLREFGRTVAVHGHLTNHRTHARLLEELHQSSRAVGMDGREHTGTHRAEAPQVADKQAIHPLGVGRIRIFLLFREGVVLQPRQQFQIHRDTLVTVLGSVDVHIIHGGDQQTVAEIHNLIPLAAQRLKVRSNTRHATILHGDIAVLHHLEAGSLLGIEDMRPIYFLHFPPLIVLTAKIVFFSNLTKFFSVFLLVFVLFPNTG